MGRPSSFNDTCAEEILDRIADGESLRCICESDEMPSKTTVMRWLAANEIFRDQYRVAREMQADSYLDDQVFLSDGATMEDWQLKKFQADTRKWVAARLAPKKYGEKQTVDMNVNNFFDKSAS